MTLIQSSPKKLYIRIPVRVTWVSLNKDNITLSSVWDTEQLVATITPANAEDTAVTWSSSDTSIATVSNTGLVTCVSPWDATITVTTHDGWYTASCTVEPAPWCLCFTANTAGSTVILSKFSNATTVTLETSTDEQNWTTYVFSWTSWPTITLSNIWDKVYWRNTSTTTTGFSVWEEQDYYRFILWWNISLSWDITYLINKNGWVTSLSPYCFNCLFKNSTALRSTPKLPSTSLGAQSYAQMFYWCTNLTTATKLPATTLGNYCYYNMFSGCSNLTTLPKLPATALRNYCYANMFTSCSKIKLSTTQTGEYQTEYRIPTVWAWTAWTSSLNSMFSSTWWTFKSTPTINTTYYTSNTLV